MNSSPNSERSRLARELHDGLAQELASVGYQLDQLVGDPTLDNKNRRGYSRYPLFIERVD